MSSGTRAFVGLGSNVGASGETLAAAIATLAAMPAVRIAEVSRLYRTRPVGPVAQPDFLNAVVELVVPGGADPASGAMAFLIALKRTEAAFGRIERQRWGPREIDLDLLLFGDHVVHVERDKRARSDDGARAGVQWLDVPHPAARERSFVLAPLADIAPRLAPPGWGMDVATALAVAGEREGHDAVEAVAMWDDELGRWSGLD